MHRPYRQVEDITSSFRCAKWTTEATLDNQDFTAPVAAIAKMEAEKAGDVEWRGKEGHQKFVEAAYSTGKRCAASNGRLPTDILEKRTDKKAYSEFSEEPVPELPPWNVVMAGSKSKRYTTKPERELNVYCLKVIEPVKDRFAAAVHNQNDRLLKRSSRYDDDVAKELHKVAKKLSVEMKDSTISGKDRMQLPAFSQDCECTYDACKTH